MTLVLSAPHLLTFDELQKNLSHVNNKISELQEKIHEARSNELNAKPGKSAAAWQAVMNRRIAICSTYSVFASAYERDIESRKLAIFQQSNDTNSLLHLLNYDVMEHIWTFVCAA